MIVVAELAVGVESLPKRGRRARLVVELRRRGRKMPLFDSMIAATARAHELTIVTRNVRDFEPAEVALLNPFSDRDSADPVHERDETYRS